MSIIVINFLLKFYKLFYFFSSGFEMTLIFLKNIINDKSANENVKDHMVKAYEKTAKPLHNVILQKLTLVSFNLFEYHSTINLFFLKIFSH